MKVGDSVLIKSYEEISAGQTEEVSYGFYTGSFFFDQSMKGFCGNTEKINHVMTKSCGTVYKLENGWWWLDKWVTSNEFLTDKDFDI